MPGDHVRDPHRDQSLALIAQHSLPDRSGVALIFLKEFHDAVVIVILPEELVRPVLNGNQVKKSDFPDRLKGIRNGQEIRLRTPEGAFVGIFRLDKGLVRTVKYYYD